MNPFRLVALTALATSPSFAIYAADATVAADPEPVEYVRVCDAYGAGYFFVPGTDTYLKLGGSVRFDVQAGDAIGRDVDKNMRGDSLDSRARAVVNFASASDTDVGTLKTYTELRFHWMGGWGGPNFASSGTESTGYYQVNAAFIELAGFRIGKDTSAFTTYLGYGGEVMQDWVVRYGPFDANLISYTYENGNGFSAIVSLEDDSGLGRGGLGNEGNGGGYVPNVVAGLGYDAGAFDFKVVGGYDEYKGAGAIKARMNGTIGDISGFLMAGWNTNADDGVNRYAIGLATMLFSLVCPPR